MVVTVCAKLCPQNPNISSNASKETTDLTVGKSVFILVLFERRTEIKFRAIGTTGWSIVEDDGNKVGLRFCSDVRNNFLKRNNRLVFI